MGFYGNITNTNKTQFTFDRTYPNRKTMEAKINQDSIYLGRYVLIEYDLSNDTTLDTFLKLYYNATDGYFYTSSKFEILTRVRWTDQISEGTNNDNPYDDKGANDAVLTNQIIYTEEGKKHTFYRCVGSDPQGYALFNKLASSEMNYTSNYAIDIAVYGEGRGYDSTVWQKVYANGTEKFVMIAELNSVVPTFDLSADAPTMTPITPHFDADSTNVYYKLHWQPSWGFRVKEGNISTSDEGTTWYNTSYNPTTNELIKTETKIDNAAIFYNKDGFSEYIRHKVTNPQDYIKIEPTGISGVQYNAHDGSGRKVAAEDIQEFSLSLPSIGNMMSDAWDIIHGSARDDSPASSLQGRLNYFNEMNANEIPVQSNGKYLVGTTVSGDAWIQPTINVQDDNNYHQDAFTIFHTYNKIDDTETVSCKNGTVIPEGKDPGLNNNTLDTLKLYTPYIDETGHVIGHNTETVTLPYGYKTFTIGDQSTNVAELTTNTATVVASNTQDAMTVSSANKWIRLAGDVDQINIAHAISDQVPITVGNTTLSPKFGDSFKIPRFTTDEAGHITAASDQTITLQKGSYTPADNVSESTEVIASIEFDSATGDITSTKADSSTLKLASYSAGTDDTDVADGDTYNSAFAKLQNQINGLDYSESSTTQIITGITQADGLIQVTRGNAGTLVLTGYTLDKDNNADIAATDSINVAFSKLQQQILDEEKARADAIAGLDAEITTEPYEVISAIVETDGKISNSTSTKKKVGELTLSGYSKPTSGSAVDQSDTLNAALGKLEFKLDTEIDRVDKLDYTDPNTNTTQIITKVTQTDGKIEVARSNAGTLLLTDYVVGTNGEKIASTDSINTAFAKLQTQINNVIGSEEIATSFDSIKKISDWLDANDSDADKVIDSIATLNGGDTTSGSVAYQIKNAVNALDSDATVNEGKYITGIHIVDGKLDSIDEADLPIYVSNVQADWNATEGLAVILNKPTNLVVEDDIANMAVKSDLDGMVKTDSNFTYPEIKDKADTVVSEATTFTIETLMQKIAELEMRIYALEHPEIKPIEPTPEPEPEPTPDEDVPEIEE